MEGSVNQIPPKQPDPGASPATDSPTPMQGTPAAPQTPPAKLSGFVGMPKFDGGPKDTRPTPTPAIKTFKADVAETVQKDHISVVQMALAESRKRQQEAVEEAASSPVSKSNLTLIISSVVLILLALGAVGYFYWKSMAPAPVVPTVVQNDIIFSESSKTLSETDYNMKSLISLINNERDVQLPLGSVIKLQIGSSTQISTTQFFNLLYTRIPPELLRSFDPSFFLGLHAYTANEPFLIIPIANYDTAYAGMLQWEPNIKDDIGDLFIKPSVPVVQPTSTGTTTDASSTDTVVSVAPPPTFEDKVIQNQDARALVDSNGKILFFYSFVDKQTLIFTTNSDTLKELLARLTKPKLIH